MAYDYYRALQATRKRIAEEERREEMLPKTLVASGLVPKPQKADPEKTGKTRSPVEKWIEIINKARNRYKDNDDYEGLK